MYVEKIIVINVFAAFDKDLIKHFKCISFTRGILIPTHKSIMITFLTNQKMYPEKNLFSIFLIYEYVTF